MSNRSDTFGRLLKGAINSIATYESKTAPIIEEELAEKVHLAGSAIQRYKAGHLPPDPRTIEIIGEAAVRRGYLNREWLQQFLHAARYPNADKLIDQLCPIGTARPRPPRVYQNLPAPTYSQFVMRDEAFAEAIDGLGKRSAAVLILGLGGNGKTSLAREVADHCLKGDGRYPAFDAAVWISDKDRPGTTNLSLVLDEIARTLDYPGFTEFEHDEKRREVEQLLRRQRVLICVDNFETITDGALLSWLLNLPEPSKALMTTREYSRAFRNSIIVVELRGMSEGEARSLISERLRILHIEKLVNDPTQLEPLVVATGGNPKAIEITLGVVKYERRPLQQVVDDLYAARGELFDDLFTRAWALLDEAARRVLLVMTFFPSGASSDSLSMTADVQGYAFDRAVERLADLALLDVQLSNLTTIPRYALHPLVRAFATMRLLEQPGFEDIARNRWVNWYMELASKVGFCWNDLGRLHLLDPEYETVFSVAQWLFQHQQYRETIRIDEGVGYYFYIRGLWDKRLAMNRMRIDSARKLKDHTDEAQGLSYYVEVLCKRGDFIEAEKYMQRLRELSQDTSIPRQQLFDIQRRIGFYYLARRDVSAALKECEKALSLADLHTMQGVIARRWLGTCLYLDGKVEQAKKIFQQLLPQAMSLGSQRSIIFCKLKLAEIDIEQGCFDRAHEALEASHMNAVQYQDRIYAAEIKHLTARLRTGRGDIPGARAAFDEAIDLFERLGMRRELAEAREELRRIEAGEVSTA